MLLIPFFSKRAAIASTLTSQIASVSTDSTHSTQEQKRVEKNFGQKTSSLNFKKTSPNTINETNSTQLGDQKNSTEKKVIGLVISTPKNLVTWVKNNPIVSIGWGFTFRKAWKLSNEVNTLQKKVIDVEENLRNNKFELGINQLSAQANYEAYRRVCGHNRL